MGYNDDGTGFSNNDTSKSAAKALNAGTARAEVYRLLKRHGPMADFDIHGHAMRELGWHILKQIPARRKELVNQGVVRETKLRDVNPVTGRPCIVWEVVPTEEIERTRQAIEDAAYWRKHLFCPHCGETLSDD